MLKRIIILLLFVQFSFGQVKEGIELCFEYKRAVSAFTSDKEANEALDKILSVIGASKNFTLTPCDNIFNALAVTYKGERYILYDGEFMKKISELTNDWSSTFILAHEVGHHINGHTRDFLLANVLDNQSLEDRRKEELEADKFAGFVLAKLGASLNQTIAAIDLMASNSDDRYSTHPNKNKRIESIRIGYSSGSSNFRGNSGTANVKRDENIKRGYSAWERVEQNFENPFEKSKNEAYTFGIIKPSKSDNMDIKPKFSITKSENGNYYGKLSNINVKFSSTLKTSDYNSSAYSKILAKKYQKSNMDGLNFKHWQVPTNFKSGAGYHYGSKIKLEAQFLFNEKESNYVIKNSKQWVSNGCFNCGGYYEDSSDPPPKIGNNNMLNQLTFEISEDFLENLKKYPKVYFRINDFSQQVRIALDAASLYDEREDVIWFSINPLNPNEYIEFDLTGSSKALSF